MSEIIADTAQIADLDDQLDALDRHGFLLVRNALPEDVVLAWRECLVRKYERREWDISNEVGNVAFDHLLEQEPELARPMVGHPSVAPYLQAMLGRQCQLRSFRAHLKSGRLYSRVAQGLWLLLGRARRGATRAAATVHKHHVLPNGQRARDRALDLRQQLLPQRSAGGNPPPRRVQFRQPLLPVVRAAGAHPPPSYDRRRSGVLQPHPAPGRKAKGRCRRTHPRQRGIALSADADVPGDPLCQFAAAGHCRARVQRDFSICRGALGF